MSDRPLTVGRIVDALNQFDLSRKQLEMLREIIDAEPAGFFRQIRESVCLVFVRAIGQKTAFDECVVALDCLVDAILDAIEREDPRYEEMLTAALDDVFSVESSENIQQGDTRDWLKTLLD